MTMIQRSLFAACTACLFSAGVTLGQTEQSFDDLFSDLDSLLPQDAPATVTASEAPAEEVWSDLDTIANSEATAADANAESASEPEVASEPQMTDAAEVEEPAPAPVLVEEPETEVVEQAKLLAEQEEVRRQAQEQAGLQQYTDGLAAMDRGDYAKAIELLEQARENLGVRPGNDARVAEAGAMLVDAYVETAKAEVKASPDQASEAIQKALAIDPANRKAQSMEKRVAAAQRWSEKQAAQKPQPAQMPKYKSKADEIASLIKEGRALFELGEYNDAEAIFDKALSVDEYNVDAMRFLRKIGEIRYDRRTTEREATVADMIQDVRNAWNPATRGDIVSPETITGEGPVPTDTPAQRLQRKMESIRIRAIEFRQANIQDVVQLLVRESIAADPEGNGVNIILNLKLPGGSDTTATPAPATDDPFGFGGGGGFDDFGFPTDSAVSTPAAATGGANIPLITLNLRNITLLEAIKYITEVADLKYRLEDNVVIITPANVVTGRVVTRLYPVQPSFLDVIVEREETDSAGAQGDFIEMGGKATMKRGDVKEFFERTGVPFPVGTSITYNPSISQLIVANTPENLETFERILSRLNVVPNQVEIEARFVEVNQNDLEELGLQWIFTDNYEIAQRQGNGGVAGTETIQLNADPAGATKGLRFFNQDASSGAIDPVSAATAAAGQTLLGNILTFAGVLTNPELEVVVQALSQSGNSDLLSAPRVTTRSGVNAQIQVVTEIIYPTEFESEVVTVEREVAGGGTSQERFVTVTPGTFETREVGVILNVTPTVGPDGYTIDLTLAPEVAELVDWLQYGSTIEGFQYNIPQPVFASRNVTTSIVVWDGQTVVLGGLIREELTTMRDKIPLLGDIPWLGRLFRSEGEYSKKINLMIFVTARLVDPAGRPINKAEALGLNESQGTPSEL
ncbi:MAG: hypothetical protein H7A43_02400 [Verrucomicrobia bacterium]|nr:hypothetical protein [Verrucomicrobiota bacterium]